MTQPDQDRCKVRLNVPHDEMCPNTFVVMSSMNFTSAKCVPDDLDKLEFEERTRQVNDPNRSARGYELLNVENVNIWRTGSPIGICDKRN